MQLMYRMNNVIIFEGLGLLFGVGRTFTTKFRKYMLIYKLAMRSY